ncbi:MAG: sugar nucleotide-binding protein, partial [Pseudomonadota bacterium]
RTEADAVINAAAYTAVDRAEEDEAHATLINGEAPGAMARAAAAKGVPFLHISTDYVFDGAKDGAWSEDDPTAPLGAYGRSKLKGEEAVRAAGGGPVILRTAWVFSAHGSNFVKTMLRLARAQAAKRSRTQDFDRDRLAVVDDQWGGPTPAADIAAALVAIARAFRAGRGVSGTFHFAGQPATTWCRF